MAESMISEKKISSNKSNQPVDFSGASCPLPLTHPDQIVIGHGSGGRMSHQLIEHVFASQLQNPILSQMNDAARVGLPADANLTGHLAVSTDAHIVSPLTFPGGDIGRLAVCGTVNDVCMLGAIPLYLTASFIIEEGFKTGSLEQIVASMRTAANEAGVAIIAGDTKVVERGKADGLFISTTGVGWIPTGRTIGGEQAKPGDAVLISGFIGDHGIAVLSARGDLGFETQITSDTAPLNSMIASLLHAVPQAHVLRDPTRGGLATSLNEIAQQSHVNILIEEKALPIRPAVRAACEMLGFDPLYVANEGKLIAIVPTETVPDALGAMRANRYGLEAVQIGTVRDQPAGRVLMKTRIGGTRVIDMLAGEMLPRIC